MCYWVINENGKVLARTTVQDVPEMDLKTDVVRVKAENFKKNLKNRLDDTNFLVDDSKPEGSCKEGIIIFDDLEMVEYNAIGQGNHTDDSYDQCGRRTVAPLWGRHGPWKSDQQS